MVDVKTKLQEVFQLQKQQQHVVKMTSAEERIEKLQKLKVEIIAQAPSIMEALQQDLGKPAFEAASSEMLSVISEIDYFTANLKQWMEPHVVPARNEGAQTKIISEPKGQCLIYSAWNFPFMLLFLPLVPAIGAGNVCILKPSELAPATSAISAKIITKVFDESEVAILEGGVDVATLLLEQPFNHIFFTGSTHVGREIMQAAGKHLASVTLELGGNAQSSLMKTLIWRKLCLEYYLVNIRMQAKFV